MNPAVMGKKKDLIKTKKLYWSISEMSWPIKYLHSAVLCIMVWERKNPSTEQSKLISVRSEWRISHQVLTRRVTMSQIANNFHQSGAKNVSQHTVH